MASSQINTSTFQFLRELESHNNREWFAKNKEHYLMAHQNALDFTQALIDEMNKHDLLVPRSPKQSLFRIYRDIRFSKDKTPYKTGFMGSLKRATKLKRGGYYFNLEPGNTVIAGGFWGPDSNDISRIRQEIDSNPDEFRKIFNAAAFKRNFGMLQGDEVKTAPRGFTKDHPNIDLLRKKQFLLVRHFTDEQATSPQFVQNAVKTYLVMRPFFDFMSDILTTDENGVSIV